MTQVFAPPIDRPESAPSLLRSRGYVVVDAAGLARLVDTPLVDLEPLRASWDDLALDRYLKDGGRYRRRRHSCFALDAEAALEPVAHRAHWQPVEYNALHGGMRRWFEPIAPPVSNAASWNQLIRGLGRTASAVEPVPRWHVEAHQFRIDTAGGIGRPTPEGAHRDGVDFVAVILIGRRNVKGGETRVFAADGSDGLRFTMTEPWTALLMDDRRVIHETTPIQPLDAAMVGMRDTLVVTYRAAGFQGGVETD